MTTEIPKSTKKVKMYKKCQAAIQKMHSGLIFRNAVGPENKLAWQLL